ncbi:MAG: hypothetical protein FJ303_26205 [Planctomycetes bacterium]|nr:hypothetical protein [Planctomycetota bacterium]
MNPRLQTTSYSCIAFLFLLGSAASAQEATLFSAWTRAEPCCSSKPKCFTPIMFGDILPYIEQDNITDGTSNTRKRLVALPVSYGALKIAENEGVRPQDRVFGSYNYYNNVLGIADVHREIIGFEKTFLNGNASIGLRVPFYQSIADSGRNQAAFDDLTVILKYAVINRPDVVVSTGIAVTVPTGPGYQPIVGDARDVTYLQPFIGAYYGKGNVYVHGFSSFVYPTDTVAPAVWFNDLGVGYFWQLKGRWLTAIVPTAEVHVTTPMNHRSQADPERRRDTVDLTGGAHFLFGNRTSIGVAVGTPVTGPRPFSVEGLLNFNWRY